MSVQYIVNEADELVSVILLIAEYQTLLDCGLFSVNIITE